MEERETFVEVWGIKFDCTYIYEPEERQTFDDPGCPANAILTVCKVGGVDIFEMLTGEQTTSIESAILSYGR